MKPNYPATKDFSAARKFFNFVGRVSGLKSSIFRSDIPRKDKIKRLIFTYSAFSSIPTLLYFSLKFTSRGSWVLGILMALGSLFTGYILFYAFRKSRNTEKWMLTHSASMVLLMLLVLAKSAPSGHPALWLYLCPPFFYLFLNMNHAMVLNTLFLLGILGVVSARDFLPWGLYFEEGFRFRFPLTMAGVMGLAFTSELLRSRYEWRMIRQHQKLQKEKEKLAQAKKQVELTSHAKSDFLANMSHELRTPLNHIIGFTELVSEKSVGDLNEVQEEYLKDVLHSARHLFNLINDTLDLAKADAGRLEFQRGPVSIQALVSQCLEDLAGEARNKGVRVHVEISGLPETLSLDKTKIKRVFNSIISNAIKYSPEGGEVRVHGGPARNQDLAEHGLNASGDSAYVEICVKDNGVGIPAGDLERILHPFEQVEAGTNRKYSGIGLGLALARRWVVLHQGRLWAKSDGPGKGSEFHVILPVGIDHSAGSF